MGKMTFFTFAQDGKNFTQIALVKQNNSELDARSKQLSPMYAGSMPLAACDAPTSKVLMSAACFSMYSFLYDAPLKV